MTDTASPPRRNAWDGVSTPDRRRSASRVLVVVGGVLLFLAVISVVLYRTLLDTQTFASSVDEIRSTEAVSDALGREITEVLVEGRPDLVAIRPLIEQVSAEVARSDVLTPLVTRAAAEAQRAATQESSSSIALRLADAGAVATSALRAFAPDVASQIPADLSITLAEIGGQDVFATTVRASRYLSVAAWVLPLVAISALGMSVWIAPNQRRGLVRAGLATVGAGAALGAVTLVLGVVAATFDTSTLTGALVDGAWQVWSRGFWVATAALLVAGSVVASAAGALLPDVDVPGIVRAVGRRVSTRPDTTEGVALRGVAVTVLGVALVVQPMRVLTWTAVLIGLGVVVVGVSEVTDAAVRARRGEPTLDEPSSDTDRMAAGWPLGLLAAGVLVVAAGVGFWAVQTVRTEPSAAAAASTGTGEVCNGHAELCDRGYDEVSYLTTHNAMSVADAPGWYLAEQPHSITSQLDGGARGLMLDVWEARPAGDYVSSLAVDRAEGRQQLEDAFGPEVVASALRVVEAIIGPPTGPPALYLCHGLCEIGATELAPTLDALRVWLDTNPDEVVSVIVENHVPAADVGAAIVAAGLEPYLATPTDTWPTLRSMITSGRRLVVMTEKGSGGSDYPWLAHAFDLTQDTPYTFPSADDFSCEPNRGTSDSPLFLVNHWLSGFGNLVSAAEQVNVDQVLGARVEQCREERGMQPTFVGVNYYSIGDVATVVAELNGVAGS